MYTCRSQDHVIMRSSRFRPIAANVRALRTFASCPTRRAVRVATRPSPAGPMRQIVPAARWNWAMTYADGWRNTMSGAFVVHAYVNWPI